MCDFGHVSLRTDTINKHVHVICCLLPRDASAERGYEIACRLSVRLFVCDDQVP